MSNSSQNSPHHQQPQADTPGSAPAACPSTEDLLKAVDGWTPPPPKRRSFVKEHRLVVERLMDNRHKARQIIAFFQEKAQKKVSQGAVRRLMREILQKRVEDEKAKREAEAARLREEKTKGRAERDSNVKGEATEGSK